MGLVPVLNLNVQVEPNEDKDDIFMVSAFTHYGVVIGEATTLVGALNDFDIKYKESKESTKGKEREIK